MTPEVHIVYCHTNDAEIYNFCKNGKTHERRQAVKLSIPTFKVGINFSLQPFTKCIRLLY